ncbi:MAG: hypothetical protein U0354_11010 [Candidatus Sericytochromatia bacterium]
MLFLTDILNIVEDKNKVDFFGDFDYHQALGKIGSDLEKGLI